MFKHPIATSATANDGLIPYNDTISDVTVRAFVGKVTRKSTLANFTEISELLIDSEFTPTVLTGDTVKLYLQYPGVTYKGNKATLIFEVELASGTGTKSFYATYVYIR